MLSGYLARSTYSPRTFEGKGEGEGEGEGEGRLNSPHNNAQTYGHKESHMASFNHGLLGTTALRLERIAMLWHEVFERHKSSTLWAGSTSTTKASATGLHNRPALALANSAHIHGPVVECSTARCLESADRG